VKLEEFLLFDGDDWRYDTIGLNWDNVAEQVVDAHRVQIRKGRQFLLFRGVSGTDLEQRHNMATISAAQSRQRQLSPQIAIIMSMFRPFSEEYGHFSPKEWRARRPALRTTYRGQPVVVLEFEHIVHSSFVKRVWTIPTLDFAISKMELGGRLTLNATWTKENSGVRLINWTLVSLSPDLSRIDGVYESEVLAYQLNPTLPADAFSFTIPVRTEVIDSTLPMTEDRLPTISVVQDDGSHRKVTWNERELRPTFAELLSTKTGEARGIRGSSRVRTLGMAATVTLTVVLTIVTILWARRR